MGAIPTARRIDPARDAGPQLDGSVQSPKAKRTDRDRMLERDAELIESLSLSSRWGSSNVGIERATHSSPAGAGSSERARPET